MNFQWNPGQQRARRDVLMSGARYCLVYGGSRSGKTFMFCRSILERALIAPGSKHLLIRQEGSAARATLARGNMATMKAVAQTIRDDGTDSGHLELPPMNEMYGYFSLPNGSEIWIGGVSDEKAMERVLGNEYSTVFCNEASEINYEAFTLLRSRLAETATKINGKHLPQRFYVDLNPTSSAHWTYKLWVAGIEPSSDKPIDTSQYAACTINPGENAANLSSDYLADLDALPPRQRKRFLLGEFQTEVPNALWRREIIQRYHTTPALTRIVVGVDPAISSNIGSDETGIICAGVDADGNGYVLDDDSGRYTPDEWARRAIALYDQHQADQIIAEANQGGAMVEATLRAHRPDVPVTLVHASRGKVTRAEPVAALYERGKVFHHTSGLDKLEEQMLSVAVGFDSKREGWSPDRVDALVWAMTELFDSLTAPRFSSGPIRRAVGTMA